MNISVKRLLIFLVLLGFSSPALGQFVTQDYKLHDVGQVIQLVTNQSRINKLGTNYGGLINTRFPPQSFQEHTGGVGWYYGGIGPNGDTLVSTPGIPAFKASNELPGYSTAPWDTVYKVGAGDTLDIGDPQDPYYSNYTPHSDQDIVTRYNDYNRAAIANPDHKPMYIDVYQQSWSWSSKPMSQFIIFKFDVVATRKPIHNFWIGVMFNALVGERTGAGFAFGQDDYATYHPKHRMAIAHDAVGGPDDGKYTPVGMKLIPPNKYRGKKIPDSHWNWTWQWSAVGQENNQQHYEQMISGNIQEDQVNPSGTSWIHTFGKIDSLSVGDTLTWKAGLILGKDREELLKKSKLVDRFLPHFNVPSAPPPPEITIDSIASGQVHFSWGDGPEDYKDPNRADSIEKPFEGYRIYKSTESINGPWTLMGVYDIAGNKFGQNAGLRYHMNDVELMNNVEYYYTVTSFSKPDTVLGFPSQESSKRANAIAVTPGTAPPEKVGKVAVVPNPYRGDIDYNDMTPPWEKPPRTRERWLEQDRRIQFINLPKRCTIKIYTLSGRLVETLHHNDPQQGFEDWNLTSNVNQAVASGIYLFTVKNEETGNVQTGKFVIIK